MKVGLISLHNLIIGSTFSKAKSFADELLRGKVTYWSQDVYKTNNDKVYEITSMSNVPDFLIGRMYDEIYVADRECLNAKFEEYVRPRLKDGGLLIVG